MEQADGIPLEEGAVPPQPGTHISPRFDARALPLQWKPEKRVEAGEAEAKE